MTRLPDAFWLLKPTGESASVLDLKHLVGADEAFALEDRIAEIQRRDEADFQSTVVNCSSCPAECNKPITGIDIERAAPLQTQYSAFEHAAATAGYTSV